MIHPTVWSQYTNVTDRTDRGTRDNESDSIGRTVLIRSPKNYALRTPLQGKMCVNFRCVGGPIGELSEVGKMLVIGCTDFIYEANCG